MRKSKSRNIRLAAVFCSIYNCEVSPENLGAFSSYAYHMNSFLESHLIPTPDFDFISKLQNDDEFFKKKVLENQQPDL